jgi:hypothetical protein
MQPGTSAPIFRNDTPGQRYRPTFGLDGVVTICLAGDFGSCRLRGRAARRPLFVTTNLGEIQEDMPCVGDPALFVFATASGAGGSAAASPPANQLGHHAAQVVPSPDELVRHRRHLVVNA